MSTHHDRQVRAAGNEARRQGFAARLRTCMEVEKVTIEELAQACGCSDSAAGHWRAGATMPGLSRMETLAEYLGVDPEWLATGKGEQTRRVRISGDPGLYRMVVCDGAPGWRRPWRTPPMSGTPDSIIRALSPGRIHPTFTAEPVL